MTDMTPEQIKAALEAGIISQSQADKMLGGRHSVDAAVIGNEDDMRFLRSFSDIFISIGLGLLALGILATFKLIAGGGVAFLGAAGIMFVLAEFFGRRKRQHLPTLITALSYLFFVQLGATGLVKNMDLGGDILVALITLIAMVIFYFRIRLPFCMALIALSVLYLVYAILLSIAPDLMQANIGWALFIGGVITVIFAILYDLRDVNRTTRFADNAFWLHLIAAPMIIHGLAVEFVSLKSTKIMNLVPAVSLDKGDASLIMVMVLVIAVFGLAINRRALLVSSLGYAGFAIGFLMKNTGLDIGSVVALTFVILGAAVMFLGVGWHAARRALLKVLPNWKIFPPVYEV